MSLGAKMAEAGVGTAKAPQTAPKADTVKGAKGKDSKVEQFKRDGASLRAAMSEDQKALEGSKSDTIEFVSCLGNPMKKRNRKTEGKYVDAVAVVGYRFKSTEDIQVPVAPFKDEPKDQYDVNKTGEKRAVKAGEEFDVNVIEAAILMSQVEYAGTASGGGQEVYMYPNSSQDSAMPRPAFRSTGGSIKENTIMIAEKVGEEWQVKPGFEAFAAVVKKRAGRSKGAGKGKSRDNIKDAAAAFRKMYASS